MELRKCYRVLADFDSSVFEECGLDEIQKGELFVLQDPSVDSSEGYFEDGTLISLATGDGFIAEGGIPTIQCESEVGRTSLPVGTLLLLRRR